MALIPVYFTVADYYRIDNSSNTDIQAGTLLRLTQGEDDVAFVAKATATSTVIGIAGDSHKLDAPASASGYAADITVGAYGQSTARTQNHIYDMYKEGLGSGKMTVYTVGGKFATTMYANVSFGIGQKLYSDANGLVTNTGSGPTVGICVGVPTKYPSGVPGTDTSDNSISLGTYLTFVLNIMN